MTPRSGSGRSRASSGSRMPLEPARADRVAASGSTMERDSPRQVQGRLEEVCPCGMTTHAPVWFGRALTERVRPSSHAMAMTRKTKTAKRAHARAHSGRSILATHARIAEVLSSSMPASPRLEIPGTRPSGPGSLCPRIRAGPPEDVDVPGRPVSQWVYRRVMLTRGDPPGPARSHRLSDDDDERLERVAKSNGLVMAAEIRQAMLEPVGRDESEGEGEMTMSTITLTPATMPFPFASPPVHRITVDEYERIIRAGRWKTPPRSSSSTAISWTRWGRIPSTAIRRRRPTRSSRTASRPDGRRGRNKRCGSPPMMSRSRTSPSSGVPGRITGTGSRAGGRGAADRGL